MNDIQIEALAIKILKKQQDGIMWEGISSVSSLGKPLEKLVLAAMKEMYNAGAKEEKSVYIERLWNSESKTLDYCDLIIDGKRTESKHLDYMDKETFFKVINNLFKSPNKTT